MLVGKETACLYHLTIWVGVYPACYVLTYDRWSDCIVHDKAMESAYICFTQNFKNDKRRGWQLLGSYLLNWQCWFWPPQQGSTVTHHWCLASLLHVSSSVKSPAQWHLTDLPGVWVQPPEASVLQLLQAAQGKNIHIWHCNISFCLQFITGVK